MISDLVGMEENMKIDLRKVTPEVREAVRRNAIGLVKGGMRKNVVASLLGAHRNSMTTWCREYAEGGMRSLKEKKRGAAPKQGSRLTVPQERQIQRMITDTMPDQLKLPYGLWTRKAVIELVEREFGITMIETTMGNYLRRWGFTPQKPKKVAYEQRPAEIRKWLEENYPAIGQRSKEENAEIHWGDETGVRNDCQHGRSFAPKGRTPVKKSMAKRFSVNMISTVTNQGKVSFMIYTDRMNADRFISFLKQLIKHRKRKIFLIVDNLRVHHSKLVKAWVVDHQNRIELFYLPSYSPQHNPDEYLNCDLKQALSNQRAPKEKDVLKGNVMRHMKLLQGQPTRVRSYFRHEAIAYAA